MLQQFLLSEIQEKVQSKFEKYSSHFCYVIKGGTVANLLNGVTVSKRKAAFYKNKQTLRHT